MLKIEDGITVMEYKRDYWKVEMERIAIYSKRHERVMD